jgi:hypothetical protein
MDINDADFSTLYIDRSRFPPDAFVPRRGLGQSQVVALVWAEQLARDYRAGRLDTDAIAWVFTRMVVESSIVHLLVGECRHLLDSGLGQLCTEIVDRVPAPYDAVVRFLADAAEDARHDHVRSGAGSAPYRT